MSRHWPLGFLLISCFLLSNDHVIAGVPANSLPGERCGMSNPNGLNGLRVPKGRLAKDGQFPWVVALFEKDEYFGDGSLIAPGLILTAGHIVRDKSETDIMVRAGVWNLAISHLPFSLAEKRPVLRIMVHENFDYLTGANNLALLFLSSPFVMKTHIQTICLPRREKSFRHSRCKVAGWGKRSYHRTSHSNFLKVVDLHMVDRAVCQAQWPNTVLGDNLICATGEAGQDACRGNGGAALFCALEGTQDRYEQAGIVQQKDMPATYTNVAKYRNWIDPHLAVVVSVPGNSHLG